MKKLEPIVEDVKMSTAEAAALVGRDERTIRRWCVAGLIEHESIKLGSRVAYRVSRASLLVHVASFESGTDQPAR